MNRKDAVTLSVIVTLTLVLGIILAGSIVSLSMLPPLEEEQLTLSFDTDNMDECMETMLAYYEDYPKYTVQLPNGENYTVDIFPEEDALNFCIWLQGTKEDN